MARKKLLTEGEIRQFMKLASMRPIGEKRLQELGGGYPPMPPGARDDDDALPPADDSEVEDMPDPAPAEMPEPEPEGAELSGEQEAAVSLLQHIQGWAEDRGIEMDVEETEEGMMDPEGLEDDDLGAMEDEDAVEMELDEPEDMPEPLAEYSATRGPYGSDSPRTPNRPERCYDDATGKQVEKDPNTGKCPEGAVMRESASEDDIVAEVAKRVAARLQREQKKEQMVDQLAERIMKRLTK